MMQGRHIIHRIGPHEIAEDVHDNAFRPLEALGEGDTVYMNASGYIGLARANASGTMHAIGVTVRAASSGLVGPIRSYGRLVSSSFDFSGFIGKNAYVSPDTAGGITLLPPSNSGEIIQLVGMPVSQRELMVNIGAAAQRDGGLL